MSDPANGAAWLAGKIATIADGAPIVVEQRYERRVAVEVERNSKGYRWHISVAADNDATVRALVDELDSWLSARFGD